MTFDRQYLTLADYKALGGSSAMEQTPFDLLEFEARRKIDIYTQNRLKNVDYEKLPQEVKLCDYALINSIERYIESISESSGNIKSENTDGYSISYISADAISNVVKSKNDELEDIIRTYLLEVIYDGEHLMYIGVE